MHSDKKYIRSSLSLESPNCLHFMSYIDNLDLVNLPRLAIIKYLYKVQILFMAFTLV